MTESQKVITSLLEIASCPVCYERLRPPAVCCVNGHAVCEKCKSGVTKCPICSGKFSEEKHTILYKLLEALPSICSFRGCSELTVDIEHHEKWCGFRITKCKRCLWSGPSNELRAHVEGKHILADTYTEICHMINKDFEWTYARVQDDQVFWDIRKNDLKEKTFKISMVWVPDGKIRDNVFQMKVEFQSKKTTHVASTRITFHPKKSSEEENGFTFHKEMLKPFIQKNDIAYNLYLTKDTGLNKK